MRLPGIFPAAGTPNVPSTPGLPPTTLTGTVVLPPIHVHSFLALILAVTNRTNAVVSGGRPTGVPVMVTVANPSAAVELAVRVSVLLPAAGFVPNDAVTPLGSPDALSITLPVNAPPSFTVTVLAPDVP